MKGVGASADKKISSYQEHPRPESNVLRYVLGGGLRPGRHERPEAQFTPIQAKTVRKVTITLNWISK